MSKAIYPGSFDPITNGHIDIATRAAELFDHVFLAVYDRPLKNLLFSTSERLAMAREALKDLPNVSVESYNGLTANYARSVEARAIVRGLRVLSDFELEFQMALTNRKLAPEIETVCLITRQENMFLSSSVCKEIALVGGCVDQMVPPHVARALGERFSLLGADGGGKVQIVSLRD